MGKVKTLPAYPKGLTFEDVWAALMESRKQQEADRKNLDRRLEEDRKNLDRQLEESRKDFDRQMREYNKRFGEFTNRFGEIVEYMVAPNLRKKFKEAGLVFQETTRDREIVDEEQDIYLEVDVMLENGDKAMLVETKTKPAIKDVKEHIARLEKMRVYADRRGDRRSFLGAVAGVVMTPNVKKYILDQGLFALEPSGETFTLTPPKGRPREW